MQHEQSSNRESTTSSIKRNCPRCGSGDVQVLPIDAKDNLIEVMCLGCQAIWRENIAPVPEPTEPPPLSHHNITHERIATALERIADGLEDWLGGVEDHGTAYSQPILMTGASLGSSGGNLPSLGQDQADAHASVMSKFTLDSDKLHLKGQTYPGKEKNEAWLTTEEE